MARPPCPFIVWATIFAQPSLDLVAEPPYPLPVWPAIFYNNCWVGWILWLIRYTRWSCEPLSLATLFGFLRFSRTALPPFELLSFATLIGICGWTTIPIDFLSPYLLQPWLDFAAEPLYPLIFWAAIYCHADFILRLNHYTHWFFEPLSFATLAESVAEPDYRLTLWATIFCNPCWALQLSQGTFPPFDHLNHYLLQLFGNLWLSYSTVPRPFAPLSLATFSGSCGWATLPSDRLPHYLLHLFWIFLDLVAGPHYPFPIWAAIFCNHCWILWLGHSTLKSFEPLLYLLQALLDVMSELRHILSRIMFCLAWAGSESLPFLQMYICIYINNNRLNFELSEPSPL